MTDFSLLIETNPTAIPDQTLQLPAGTTVLEATDALDRLFATHPDIHNVMLHVGISVIGVTSREHLGKVVDRGSPPVNSGECPECHAHPHVSWCSAAPQHLQPSERISYQDIPGEPANPAAIDGAIRVQHQDNWLAGRYVGYARWAYDIGIVAHLAGLGAILVPSGAGQAGRWVAVGVVLLTLALEAIWIIASHGGPRPAWLLPDYMHARNALAAATTPVGESQPSTRPG